MEIFAASIYAFCAISAKQITVNKEENSRICWEVLINCSVDKDGGTNKDTLLKCQEKYRMSK